jgi:hypothetical protein
MYNKWEKSTKLYSNRGNGQNCNQIKIMAKIAKVALKTFIYKFVLAWDKFKTYLATNPSNGKSCKCNNIRALFMTIS